MADGILGLAGGGASSLNQELIDKLKAAEKTAKVDPLEKKLEDWDKEFEAVTKIEEKFNALLDVSKSFDLFNSSKTVFDQKTASATGTGALFDAVDVANLQIGVTKVEVTTLAKKDVYQSNAVNGATKDATLGSETLNIQVGSDPAFAFDTNGKTYDELAKEINLKEGLSASVEQVGDDSYRLVIKSSETGTANALTISGTASQTLGYTTDGTTIDGTNHIQAAVNLVAKVDGIDYNSSSNELSIHNGALKITAVEENSTSSVNIQKDNTSVVDGINKFVEAFNALNKEVNDAIYGEDRYIEDSSSIKDILSQIKEKVIGSYGSGSDKNLFNIGIELQKDGSLTVDTAKLNESIATDFDSVKALMTGDIANYGLGTQLKEVMFDMTLSTGALSKFGEALGDKKTNLESDKEEATKKLDDKYSAMSARFGEYAAIIARMEASFGGLKMMIQQSTAQN